MDLLETLRMSFESIKSAKLRSSLTTLGVVIGVAAVIANVSIGAGFSAFFTDQILSIGSNFIFVTEKMPNVLRDHELEIIENTPGVIGASPISGANAKVKYMFDTKTIDVWGLSKEYEKVGNIKMAEGSFLSDNDKYAAVIGYDVANTKFNRNLSLRNPIEITFTLRDGTKVTKRFKVKGIIENQEFKLGGPGDGPSPNDRIFIPIDTLLDILGDKDYNTIFASAESMNNIKEVSEEIDKRLARNIGIPKKDLKDKDAKPYSIHTQEEFLKIMEQMSSTMTIMLTAVALISLIVGSIGIMNIMLVTVTERTREIGIMKALGATRFDVLSTFLVESAVIGLFGGFLGVGLGYIGAYGAQNAIGLPNIFPIEWVGIGLGVAVIVGIIAGVYPAFKAARMNPVDALRHE